MIFDVHDDDVYCCGADIGWVTGHSYVVYGPLTNGATSIVFESTPLYPDAGRYWQMIDKFKITQFYTAPTAIRALIRQGDEWPAKYKMDSLKVLGSVGEPINPEAWIWYYEKIGHSRCPSWTPGGRRETGGILITPLPGAAHDQAGQRQPPVLRRRAGGPARGRHRVQRQRGRQAVHSQALAGHDANHVGRPRPVHRHLLHMYKDLYFTGDGCRIDPDGDYWLMGRIDDVVNVSGHRIGTAEVESALVSHPKVAEAAVAPMPHDIKGQGLYAYVTLRDGVHRARNCVRSWSSTSARKSAPSPPRTRSNSPRPCPKRDRARSCGESSARSPRASPTAPRWAT